MPQRPDDPGRCLNLPEILELFRRLEPSKHPIDEEQRIRLRYQFCSLRRKLDPRNFLGQRQQSDKMKINPRAAFFGQRFPDLMSDLIRRYYEIFLLEPMLSAQSGEIWDKPAHVP